MKTNSNACRELMSFQLSAANQWLEQAKGSQDVFAQFLLYFSGFNALFFLWSRIDGVEGDRWEIANLVRKFQQETAQSVLDKAATSVEYFRQRRPVAKMDTRTCDDPEGFEESEGNRCKGVLEDHNQSAVERLVALGQIIYLVRCNLIHGSKVPEEDRKTVSKCVEPLKLLLEASIELTLTQMDIQRR